MNPTDVRPFVATGNTVTIAATGTSAATALPGVRPGNPEMPATCRVMSAGTGIAFIKFGLVGDTGALTNDTSVPMAANTTSVFWVPTGSTHIITIVAAAGTATVYATLGQGGG